MTLHIVSCAIYSKFLLVINPLQYSCLENPMDREAWQATVHEVAGVGHDLVAKTTTIILYLAQCVYDISKC